MTKAVALDKIGISATRAVLLGMAALCSPIFLWQFAATNLEYGVLFFCFFVLCLLLMVWPLLWIEAQMAAYWWAEADRNSAKTYRPRRVPLAAMAQYLLLEDSADLRKWSFRRVMQRVGLWLLMLAPILVLLALLSILTAHLVLSLDETVAATLPSLWYFGDVENLLRTHAYWASQQAENWSLIVLWMVVVLLLVVGLTGRTRRQGTWRWLPRLWLLMFAILMALFVVSSGWVHIDANYIAVAWAKWITLPVLTAKGCAAMLMHAAQQAGICAVAGFGFWMLLGTERLRRDEYNRQHTASSQNKPSSNKSFSGRSILKIAVVLGLLVAFAAVASMLSMQLMLAHPDFAVQDLSTITPYLLQAQEMVAQTFAVAWLGLVSLALLTTILALFEVLLALTGVRSAYRRWQAALLMVMVLALSGLWLLQREAWLAVAYYTCAVGLPVVAWILITLWLRWVRQHRQTNHQYKLAPATIWYCRFPLRFAWIAVVLAGVGFWQWLLVVFRLG